MKSMFSGAGSFNQPLDAWDTSNVMDMSRMFSHAKSFNQPLNTWNTSKVKYMSRMFDGVVLKVSFYDSNIKGNVDDDIHSVSSFNQPLNEWDTSNVKRPFNKLCLRGFGFF